MFFVSATNGQSWLNLLLFHSSFLHKLTHLWIYVINYYHKYSFKNISQTLKCNFFHCEIAENDCAIIYKNIFNSSFFSGLKTVDVVTTNCRKLMRNWLISHFSLSQRVAKSIHRQYKNCSAFFHGNDPNIWSSLFTLKFSACLSWAVNLHVCNTWFSSFRGKTSNSSIDK